jgi:hypothetical protein
MQTFIRLICTPECTISFFFTTSFRTFLRCKTHYYKIRTNRKPKNSLYLQKLSYLNHNLSVFRLLKFNFVIISYLMAMLICFLYFYLNFVFHQNDVNWFFDQRGDSQSKIPLRCFETKKKVWSTQQWWSSFLMFLKDYSTSWHCVTIFSSFRFWVFWFFESASIANKL